MPDLTNQTQTQKNYKTYLSCAVLPVLSPFSLNRPIGQFSLIVAISVCVCVCMPRPRHVGYQCTRDLMSKGVSLILAYLKKNFQFFFIYIYFFFTFLRFQSQPTLTRNMWHMICDAWHVTHDMWHMTRDTWHVTHDNGLIYLIFILSNILHSLCF